MSLNATKALNDQDFCAQEKICQTFGTIPHLRRKAQELNNHTTSNQPQHTIHKQQIIIPSNTMIQTPLARIFLGCLILAVCVFPAFSEEDAVEIPAPTPFRCLGICGDDEGELKVPDLVVSYQWNSRVPVCSGLSCVEASCAALEEELSILSVTKFECIRHRRSLQDDAGCTCSKPKKRPVLQPDNISSASQSRVLGALLLPAVVYLGQALLW